MASWSLAPTTGVATLIFADDPEVTLTRTAAGTYAIVFLPSPKRAHVDAIVMNSGTSAAGMTTSARLTAVDAQAGTATIQIVGGNSGVAIDPLAADVVTLFVEVNADCNA